MSARLLFESIPQLKSKCLVAYSAAKKAERRLGLYRHRISGKDTELSLIRDYHLANVFDRARFYLLDQQNKLEKAEKQAEKLMESLPVARWSAILRFRYIENLSINEIAQCVSLCTRSVYNDINKAFIWLDAKTL